MAQPDGGDDIEGVLSEFLEYQKEVERTARMVVDGIKNIVAAGVGERLLPGQNDVFARLHGKWYDVVGRDLGAAGFRELGPFRVVGRDAPPEKDAYYRFALSEDGTIVANWFVLAAAQPMHGLVLTSYGLDDSSCATVSGLTESGVPKRPSASARVLPAGAPIGGMVKLHRREMERSGSSFIQLHDMDEIVAARQRDEALTKAFRETQGLALFEPYLRAFYKEEFDERGADILEAIMDHPEWWTGETPAESAVEPTRSGGNVATGFPHLVLARVYEHIEPLDRGERYEDPLQAVLETAQLGSVTGGGSQLNELGGIQYADVEIALGNVDEAVRIVADALENAGAPQGSEIIDANGSVLLEFGTQQCMAIFLDGTTLPDEVYASLDFEAVLGELGAAAGDNRYRGFWQGPRETGVFFFDPDAEAMFVRVEPVLRRLPIAQNARVVLRHGKEQLRPREVRMPRHQ